MWNLQFSDGPLDLTIIKKLNPTRTVRLLAIQACIAQTILTLSYVPFSRKKSFSPGIFISHYLLSALCWIFSVTINETNYLIQAILVLCLFVFLFVFFYKYW